MSPSRPTSPESALDRLWRAKHRPAAPADALGPELLGFFKHSVQKRQTKLSRIAQAWQQLIPSTLADHYALESFHAGTLKVLVDSAPHLYELKQVLLAGLQDQLLLACRSAGLKKIILKPGRWYDGDGADRKIRF